jgi:hypothetical protein
MFKILSILLFIIPFQSWALELKVGDILLQPMQCWSCTLIEAQENSKFSHMSLVIETKPQVKVAEALGKVRVLTLEDFHSRTKKGHTLSVRRFKNSELVNLIQKKALELKKYFQFHYQGLDYDEEFLWDNLDQKGSEKLYCSEMITKLLSNFFHVELPIKRMKFDVRREEWIKYFKGNPPDGMWGNSPADFEKSPLFMHVGEI